MEVKFDIWKVQGHKKMCKPHAQFAAVAAGGRQTGDYQHCKNGGSHRG